MEPGVGLSVIRRVASRRVASRRVASAYRRIRMIARAHVARALACVRRFAGVVSPRADVALAA
jgi:hypothetical protein